MAFSSRELSVLAYANGFTLWHYRSGDSVDEVLVPGYFLAADELFRSGDLVLLTLTGSGRPFGAALVVTAIRQGLSVEVTPAGWPAAPDHSQAPNATRPPRGEWRPRAEG